MLADAGALLLPAAGALLAVFGFGYVTGALLVERVDADSGLSFGIIRTVSGLLLTTIGFLLSLVLSLPWFAGPATLLLAALFMRGRSAFRLPSVRLHFQWDGIAAAALAGIIVSPIVISFVYMAPGSYPPVLYNIDTAYFLEKVHALAAATSYPPDSLSNVGIRRTYHYGTQAMAALISRSSGLLPHQSTFIVVMPLLTAGVLAAAVTAARWISQMVPRSIAVPLLLLSTPSMSTSFWDKFAAQVSAAWKAGQLGLDTVVGDYALWGILSNEGPNVGGDFLILATVAGIAGAPSWGWRLPAFLVGAAILVKTPAGVALFAGFVLVEAWRALLARRLRLSPQMVTAAGVFALTGVAFFLVSFESNFQVELYPFFHLRQMAVRSLPGFLLDVLWLFLPALIVLTAGIRDPERRSAPILLLALAPFLVVNMTRMDNIKAGGGGTGDDWFQILHAVPFLLHAFALSLASRRWSALGRLRRAAFLFALVLAVGPVAAAAATYSVALVREPAGGLDFVDNRPLATALQAIPTKGTIIVTNDLRYPAQNFTRDYRQMQIPALFGHQAFAVNYAHEAVEHRRGLQELLQQPRWDPAILDAARAHGWTHLVVRKDYVHPAPVPLDQIFENDTYAVFRFPE
jgi:hypothetical protein